MSEASLSAVDLAARRDLSFARKGLLWALLSGVLWGANGVILGAALGRPPFAGSPLWLLAPLTLAGMHDVISGLWNLLYNWRTGRLREIGRSLFTRPGLMVCLGALFGGPVGMGSYLIGLNLAGPAYVLPITSLYPAVAAALAMVFLKEKIVARAWFGLAMCVCGVAVIGWAPPQSAPGPMFFLGIGIAALATLGWGAEGVLSTSGMDLLDPAVALNIRQLISGGAYLLVVLPLAGGWSVLGQAVFSQAALPLCLAAGLGACSYLCWYRGMNMTGVSRAMACNVTYALWGILFSALFTDTEITANLVAGALVILCGMVLVVGNPREMTSLRKTA